LAINGEESASFKPAATEEISPQKGFITIDLFKKAMGILALFFLT